MQGHLGVPDANVISGTDRFGVAGQAYCFADNAYITVDDGSSLNDVDGITVSGFIRQDSFLGGNNPVVAKWTFQAQSEQFGWFVNGDDNLVAIGRANRFGTNDQAAMVAGTWYHVAFTYDKATSRQVVFVNGEITSDTIEGAWGDSDGTNIPLQIGGIDGCLDEVKVYDHALPDDEVMALAEELAPIELPVPFLSFPFDGDPDDVTGTYTGTLDADVSLTTDRFGTPDSAYAFGGGHITVAEPSNLDDFDGVSVSAFLRQDTFLTGNNVLVGKWSFNQASEQWGLFVTGDDNLVAIGRADRFGTRDDAAYSTGVWYHVAMTYDKTSGRERTYVDGVLVLDATAGAYGDSDGTVLPLEIGGLDGALDDVQVFDRELTADEVAALASQL